jgi:hypothetical protein
MAPKSISERDLQVAVRRLFHNHQYILDNSYVFNWESDLFSVTKSGNVYEVEIKISKSDYRKDFEKEKHQLFKSNVHGKSHHIFRSSGTYVWDEARIIGRFSYQEVTWQHPKGYTRDYRTHDYVTGYGQPLIRTQYVDLRAPCTKIEIKPIADILCPNRFYYASPPGIIEVKNLPPYAGLIHFEDGEAWITKQAPFIHKRPLLGGRITSILLDKFWYLSQDQRYQLAVSNIEFKDISENQTGPEGQ